MLFLEENVCSCYYSRRYHIKDYRVNLKQRSHLLDVQSVRKFFSFRQKEFLFQKLY